MAGPRSFRPPLEPAPAAGHRFGLSARLGPTGPFPHIDLVDPIERRWLHYAFLSRDGRFGLVGNAAWLGPDEPGDATHFTTIVLLHERGLPWVSSPFHAEISEPPWSAFRQPHAMNRPSRLMLASTAGEPAVDLQLTRTAHPCTSQCAPFAGNHHLRWQSEAGVRARGTWRLNGREHCNVQAVGYHERVRGRWGWPELGEWVFGFANDLAGPEDGAPPWAAVFTFIRPRTPSSPADATTASVMLWRRGRLVRHFPRRCVSLAVRGVLGRDAVALVPSLAVRFGEPPMAPVPRRLVISARQGGDTVVLDFESEAAARIVIPSETSLAPFSVHEVVGPCVLAGRIGGERFEIHTRGIVEFAGGADACR